MDEMGYGEKEAVKSWYDGFTFGHTADIYNPWSILNDLSERRFAPYWANTSSNGLVGKLVREGSPKFKQSFETLLNGGSIIVPVDEQPVYNMLNTDRNAVWSLLLAGGYVKVVNVDETELLRGDGAVRYELMLTSREVQVSFLSIVRGWFGGCVGDDYNGFVRALLSDDRKDSAKTPEAEGGR